MIVAKTPVVWAVCTLLLGGCAGSAMSPPPQASASSGHHGRQEIARLVQEIQRNRRALGLAPRHAPEMASSSAEGEGRVSYQSRAEQAGAADSLGVVQDDRAPTAEGATPAPQETYPESPLAPSSTGGESGGPAAKPPGPTSPSVPSGSDGDDSRRRWERDAHKADSDCPRPCRFTRAICHAAQRICEIASDLGDQDANRRCQRAREDCQEAQEATEDTCAQCPET